MKRLLEAGASMDKKDKVKLRNSRGINNTAVIKQSVSCVNVWFSWKPQRSTGPAEEEAFQPCSSSWTREPRSPTETRLVDGYSTGFGWGCPSSTVRIHSCCLTWILHCCLARKSNCHDGKETKTAHYTTLVPHCSSFKICSYASNSSPVKLTGSRLVWRILTWCPLFSCTALLFTSLWELDTAIVRNISSTVELMLTPKTE